MRKLKKALSLTLALALSLALAVPAFAAPMSIETTGYDYYYSNENPDYLEYGEEKATKINFSDAVSQEMVKMAYSGNIPLVTVKVGTTITPECSWPYTAFGEACVTDSGEYDMNGEETARSFRAMTDGTPYTLTEDNIGLWCFYDGNAGYSIFYLKVIASDGSTTPTEPTTPTQPEQPTTPAEPETPTQPTQPEQPTTPTAPVTPDAPGTYTVKKGDTWSSICTNFYGNNGQRYELMKANKNLKLKEGVVITLPEKLGRDTLIPAPAAGAGEKLYTVKAGDTLGRIAAAEYGKAGAYKAIFERNADRLKNANTIYEGQVIVLPAK